MIGITPRSFRKARPLAAPLGSVRALLRRELLVEVGRLEVAVSLARDRDEPWVHAVRENVLEFAADPPREADRRGRSPSCRNRDNAGEARVVAGAVAGAEPVEGSPVVGLRAAGALPLAGAFPLRGLLAAGRRPRFAGVELRVLGLAPEPADPSAASASFVAGLRGWSSESSLRLFA